MTIKRPIIARKENEEDLFGVARNNYNFKVTIEEALKRRTDGCLGFNR